MRGVASLPEDWQGDTCADTASTFGLLQVARPAGGISQSTKGGHGGRGGGGLYSGGRFATGIGGDPPANVGFGRIQDRHADNRMEAEQDVHPSSMLEMERASNNFTLGVFLQIDHPGLMWDSYQCVSTVFSARGVFDVYISFAKDAAPSSAVHESIISRERISLCLNPR